MDFLVGLIYMVYSQNVSYLCVFSFDKSQEVYYDYLSLIVFMWLQIKPVR